MSEKGYFEKATKFTQYDEGVIDRSSYGSSDDPMRVFLKETLRKEAGSLAGETVLDIGSGSGAMG